MVDVDSRLHRYQNVLDAHGINYFTIYWDRHLDGVENDKLIPIKIKSGVGQRVKNVFNLLFWQILLFFKLIKKRHSFNVIHAIDFDTVLPAFLVSKIFKKKLVYDVYDRFTDIRDISGKSKKVIDFFEDYCCNHADELILADAGRVGQHKLNSFCSLNVIENVPNINLISSPYIEKETLTLCYVGVLEAKHRGIEDLLQVASEMPEVHLNVAGFGVLTELALEYSKKFENIDFFGKLTPSESIELQSKADVLFAMYYTSNLNNTFAAPNKYYEHLLLGRPLVTTKNSPPGNKVEKHHTGWAISEGRDSIKNIIKHVIRNASEVAHLGRNANALWTEYYANYHSTVLEVNYLKILELK